MAAKKEPLPQKVLTFLRQVKVEMKKVTWPSRQDLISYTSVVLAVVVALGIFIGAVDLIFTQVVGPIFFR